MLAGEGVRDADAVLGADAEDVLAALDQPAHRVLRLGGVPGARDPVVGARVSLLDDVAAGEEMEELVNYFIHSNACIHEMVDSC